MWLSNCAVDRNEKKWREERKVAHGNEYVLDKEPDELFSLSITRSIERVEDEGVDPLQNLKDESSDSDLVFDCQLVGYYLSIAVK